MKSAERNQSAIKGWTERKSRLIGAITLESSRGTAIKRYRPPMEKDERGSFGSLTELRLLFAKPIAFIVTRLGG